jgi:peptide/nickel transport system permease protein
MTLFLLFGIIILNFSIFYLSPGDPTNLYFSPKIKKADIQALKHQMGVDKHWTDQFLDWCAHISKGDLGYSWAKHRSVNDIFKEAIPATLQLTIGALFMNLILGCFVGIIAGIHSQKWLGRFIDTVTLILYTIPSFLLALLFISLFSLTLRILPASGMESLYLHNSSFWSTFWDRLKHLIMPVTVLGLTGAAATSRYVQGHMKDILQQDYIRLAFGKGLSRLRVFFHHAFKNAMIPVVTLLGIYFPFLLGSALIIEVIFGWPGMGRVAYEAIFSKDYPVIMAVNLIMAIFVIVGNIISDLTYRFVDPRIRVR